MAVSQVNIGCVYKATGDYDKALEYYNKYYNKSLSIRVNALGENHPAVARICDAIASLNMETMDKLE